MMTRVRSFLLVIVALTAANIVSFITLSRNVVAGVYPIEADSIAIPLVEGIILSLLVLVLLCAAILVSRGKTGSVISLGLAGMAMLFSMAYSIAWAMPDHYVMALAYGCVAVVGGFLARGYVRQLTAPVAV